MTRERIVLDTSVFTNPQTMQFFGASPTEAFVHFLNLVRAAADRVEVYMPPSVYEELLHFVNEKELPADTELLIRLKSPRRFQLSVPGFFVYELIEEIRARIDRGLRVAEEMVKGRAAQGEDANLGETIHRLRNRYRTALREGILDSREDVDLILLALELDGAIVTSDQGVARWAEKLGIRLIHPRALKTVLKR